MAIRLLMPLAVVVATLSLAGPVLAGDRINIEYSADQVIESEEAAMKSRIYSTPTKERKEMDQGGTPMVLITRHDKKVMWNLMPEEKMYMEMAANKPSNDKTDLSSYKIEQTPMGQETLNGISMNKNKIIMTGKDGSKMGGFMWVTKEGIMVKIDAIAVEKGRKDRFKMELTNLQIGKQPTDLFEIPKGFEKMDMGGMGMDMGGMSEDTGGKSKDLGGMGKDLLKGMMGR